MTASCVQLWILRSCSDHLFYRKPLGNFLFEEQVAGFQRPDTGKMYFTSAFQAFYTRIRSIQAMRRQEAATKRCSIKEVSLEIS